MDNIKKQINDIKNRYTCKSIKSLIIDPQSNNYEYLVLSGGGIKGIAFTGALETLPKYGIKLENLKGIAGVSAGSIVASLLAIGYTPQELIKIMSDIDFEKIANDGSGYLSEGVNFIRNWGICEGNYIMDLLGKLIAKKTKNPDYTIEDLLNDKNIKLVIVATNTNYSNSEYFYAGNPDPMYSKIPIRIAIRMSMSIPYVFEPFVYNKCRFVDGGVLDNFPLHVFDGEYPGDPKARLNLYKPNPKVLGLKLMTDDLNPDYQMTKKHEFTGLLDYSTNFINMFLLENDRGLMVPSFWDRTLIIITPTYSLNKFDITEKEKSDLIEFGRQYTNAFFSEN